MSAVADAALLELLRALRAAQYQFVTPTPATHARVLARHTHARNLRDVFGWSLAFAPEVVGAEMLALMHDAEIVDHAGGLLKSRLRVSSLDGMLFLHSAYPTTQDDSVFFGPDSYRFSRFLRTELAQAPRRMHVVDVGTGSGVGGIVASGFGAARVTLADINTKALSLARINAAFAEANVETVLSDGLAAIAGPIDCVIANPPYIADAAQRAYRDGGAMHGAALSLDWARQAAARLPSGGALLLYTGSAIIDGEDLFRRALEEALGGFELSYREIDPDVFGEELACESYADVERIAVVGVVAIKR